MQTCLNHNLWVLIAAAAVLIGVGPAIDATLPAAAAGTAAAQSDTTRHALPQDACDFPDSLLTTIVGTVIEIESHIERDGGLFLRLNIGKKDPFEIVLGSLHTRPPPSKERLKLYKAIRGLNAGDRVEATGYLLNDGFWLIGLKQVVPD